MLHVANDGVKVIQILTLTHNSHDLFCVKISLDGGGGGGGGVDWKLMGENGNFLTK